MKTHLTVHHTNTLSQVDLTKLDIDIRDRRYGYTCIGCHYLIRRNGTIETGRHERLASVYDNDDLRKKAVSVLIVGDFENITPAQVSAFKQLRAKYPSLEVTSPVRGLIERLGINPHP